MTLLSHGRKTQNRRGALSRKALAWLAERLGHPLKIEPRLAEICRRHHVKRLALSGTSVQKAISICSSSLKKERHQALISFDGNKNSQSSLGVRLTFTPAGASAVTSGIRGCGRRSLGS